jgi:hypothetical protein
MSDRPDPGPGGLPPPVSAERLPSMKAPLREVAETISCDDVLRVERLICGHTKTTWTALDRPAKRRRCLECGRTEEASDNE